MSNSTVKYGLLAEFDTAVRHGLPIVAVVNGKHRAARSHDG